MGDRLAAFRQAFLPLQHPAGPGRRPANHHPAATNQRAETKPSKTTVVRFHVQRQLYNDGIVKEEITTEDEKLIRDIIRREVSAIFFDLFKKRKTWGA